MTPKVAGLDVRAQDACSSKASTWRAGGFTRGVPVTTTVGTVSLPRATERTKAAASSSSQMLCSSSVTPARRSSARSMAQNPQPGRQKKVTTCPSLLPTRAVCPTLPPARLPSARSGEEPGHAVAFAGGQHFKRREGPKQLARLGSEPTGLGAHLAEHGDGQQAPRHQALDDGPVEPGIAEAMAQDHVDWWSSWESVVEVDHVESAPIADAMAFGELATLSNGDRRDIQRPDLQPPLGQPHCAGAPAARDLERTTLGGEQVLMGGEGPRGLDRSARPWLGAGMPLVPTGAILLGHRRRFNRAGEER